MKHLEASGSIDGHLAPLATAWLTGGLPDDGCSAQRKPACLAIQFFVGCTLIIQTIVLDLSGAVQADAKSPTRNRKVRKSCLCLTRSPWPRSSSRGRSVAVAARLLPDSRIWDGAGPPGATRQAGDQGCCGVEGR
jgi:hypothetical protein